MSILNSNRTKIEIEVIDPDNQLIRLIDYISKLSAPGHSFSVVVDPDTQDEKSFGIDGDGSFYIKSLKVNEKKFKIDVDDKIIEEYLKQLND